MYNKVQGLANVLKRGRPDAAGNEPVSQLSIEAQQRIEAEIKVITMRSAAYMDQCGMRMPKPLWTYDARNPKTWVSDRSFKYGHLVEWK